MAAPRFEHGPTIDSAVVAFANRTVDQTPAFYHAQNQHHHLPRNIFDVGGVSPPGPSESAADNGDYHHGPYLAIGARFKKRQHHRLKIRNRHGRFCRQKIRM
jgi:hypothetical protein